MAPHIGLMDDRTPTLEIAGGVGESAGGKPMGLTPD